MIFPQKMFRVVPPVLGRTQCIMSCIFVAAFLAMFVVTAEVVNRGRLCFFFVIWMFYDVLGFGWGGHLAVR